MKFLGLAAGLMLMLQAPFANAERAPKCFGRAGELCECSALFSVLETEPTSAGQQRMAEWWELAERLRFWSYPVMGKDLGDRLINARIVEWRTLPSTIETHREFAQFLSSCARFWDGSLSEVPVSIGP
ncbi:hypothetical protein GC1_02640 [Leisingera sp. ANG1]|nr:hypothetical protein RA23_05420 [Leisingera sp. ANG-S3]KIC54634.1 hypothetical protein RA22_04630 [Leisingera sp. ANG-S]KID10600.1 hypothetical protein GC1_02640 [Leisingera sp. ANG1]